MMNFQFPMLNLGGVNTILSSVNGSGHGFSDFPPDPITLILIPSYMGVSSDIMSNLCTNFMVHIYIYINIYIYL